MSEFIRQLSDFVLSGELAKQFPSDYPLPGWEVIGSEIDESDGESNTKVKPVRCYFVDIDKHGTFNRIRSLEDGDIKHIPIEAKARTSGKSATSIAPTLEYVMGESESVGVFVEHCSMYDKDQYIDAVRKYLQSKTQRKRAYDALVKMQRTSSGKAALKTRVVIVVDKLYPIDSKSVRMQVEQLVASDELDEYPRIWGTTALLSTNMEYSESYSKLPRGKMLAAVSALRFLRHKGYVRNLYPKNPIVFWLTAAPKSKVNKVNFMNLLYHDDDQVFASDYDAVVAYMALHRSYKTVDSTEVHLQSLVEPKGNGNAALTWSYTGSIDAYLTNVLHHYADIESKDLGIGRIYWCLDEIKRSPYYKPARLARQHKIGLLKAILYDRTYPKALLHAVVSRYCDLVHMGIGVLAENGKMTTWDCLCSITKGYFNRLNRKKENNMDEETLSVCEAYGKYVARTAAIVYRTCLKDMGMGYDGASKRSAEKVVRPLLLSALSRHAPFKDSVLLRVQENVLRHYVQSLDAPPSPSDLKLVRGDEARAHVFHAYAQEHIRMSTRDNTSSVPAPDSDLQKSGRGVAASMSERKDKATVKKNTAKLKKAGGRR